MEHNGREGVDVDLPDRIRADRFLHLGIKPAGAEKGVIHKVSEIAGRDGLAAQDIQHLLLREAVARPELVRDVHGQHFRNILKIPAVQFPELSRGSLAEPGQGIEIMVGDIQTSFAPLLFIYFEIGHDLLKRKLERIADVVEEGSKAPVLQEKTGSLPVGLPVVLPRADPVKFLEDPAVSLVCLIDREPERENIHRVGIVIPVFHEKGAPVGFKLGEQFHHFLGFAVMAKKDLQIAVVDVISIFRDSGVDEALESLLQTETVDVHLHVVGNLALLETGSPEDAVCCLLPGDSVIKPEFFAAFVQKTERRGFEVGPQKSPSAQRGLAGADVTPEAFPVYLPHFFQSRICHRSSPFSNAI